MLAGVVLNLLLPADEAGEYLQELPPIRLPSLRGVAGKTGHRVLSFLREALPVFLDRRARCSSSPTGSACSTR